MTNNIVQEWFQEQYHQLHPLIQKLHHKGGTLEGEVKIIYGKGFSGAAGRVLARKLNIPNQGVHKIRVKVIAKPDGLHWQRQFGNSAIMNSVFKPVGTIHNGYWIEKTGFLSIKLTVDIVDGGWYWRCLDYKMLGLDLPDWFFPTTKAYKYIENNLYRFGVDISLPIFGRVLCYSGLLRIES